MHSIPISRSPRILICRLSDIGDCVLTLPVAVALRKYYPHAWITWVTQSPAASLLCSHESIDEVFTVPRGWVKSPRAIWNLRKQLRPLNFDWALDPQSLTRSALAAWISGAPRRIGFASPQGRELALWCNNERIERTAEHAADAFLQLLRPLGIENPVIDFQLPRDEQADQQMTSFCRDHFAERRFVILHPGAGWDSRLWPMERYCQVASFLGGCEGIPSLVTWTGDRERAWAEEIVAGSKGHATLAPATSLPELVALTRRAAFFISPDTGPMHLAAAANVPCISLHGTTKAGSSGPYGDQHLKLQAYFQSGTSRYRRGTSNDAMRAIPVEWVCQASRQIVERFERQSDNAEAA